MEHLTAKSLVFSQEVVEAKNRAKRRVNICVTFGQQYKPNPKAMLANQQPEKSLKEVYNQ